MDTTQSLYNKYLNSLQQDILNGRITYSDQTQILLAFYQEVVYRQNVNINDTITANQLLTYTHQNYN